MLIRKTNWPVILAVATIGPLFGAFIAAQVLPLDSCPTQNREGQTGEPAAKKVSTQTEQTEESLVFPDGDSVELDELAPGRATAIVVMKAPWCSVCRKQLRRLDGQLDRVQSVDGAVFGLTSADARTNRRLAEDLGLGFPILGDPSRQLHRSLTLWMERRGHAMPGVIFLDEQGQVRKVHRGRYPGRSQTGFILETLSVLSQ